MSDCICRSDKIAVAHPLTCSLNYFILTLYSRHLSDIIAKVTVTSNLESGKLDIRSEEVCLMTFPASQGGELWRSSAEKHLSSIKP